MKDFLGYIASYVLKTIGNEGILKLIDDFDTSIAHFSAIIAFYFKPIDEIVFFEGRIEGKVSNTIRGKEGFGFDPILFPILDPIKRLLSYLLLRRIEFLIEDRHLQNY